MHRLLSYVSSGLYYDVRPSLFKMWRLCIAILRKQEKHCWLWAKIREKWTMPHTGRHQTCHLVRHNSLARTSIRHASPHSSASLSKRKFPPNSPHLTTHVAPRIHTRQYTTSPHTKTRHHARRSTCYHTHHNDNYCSQPAYTLSGDKGPCLWHQIYLFHWSLCLYVTIQVPEGAIKFV